ncbi:rhomboid family intramembrane serine protease [Streptomyces coryli]|nr:rhomboid family intramembrane serine protease [Streptomyces coryli]
MTSASVGFHCPDCHQVDVREEQQGARQERRGGMDFGAGPRERMERGPGEEAGASLGEWSFAHAFTKRDPKMVTHWLMAINVLCFAAVVISGYWLSTHLSFIGRWPQPPYEATEGMVAGQWWLLLTAVFLHETVPHLLFNLVALFFVGPPVETALGRGRFLALYLLSGLGGSAFYYLVAPPDDGMLGASGAIFGLFGALVVLTLEKVIDLQIGPLLLVLGLNLVMTFTVQGIAWQSHIGGLLVGAVMAHFFVHAPKGKQATVDRVLCGAVFLVVMAVCAARTVALS